jgi:hypothetical protein
LMFGACSKKVDKHPGMREAIWGHQPGPGPLIDVNSSGMPWVGDLECWENLQNPCFRTVIFPKLYGRKLVHAIFLGEPVDLSKESIEP